jgi:glycerol-3-phosphate acyltransferase PlsY
MKFIILIIVSYFVGAIPFAQVFAKAYGKNLRSIGSGNIGATNLSRALGKRWGYFCFLLDALKGMVPMLFATRLAGPDADIVQLIVCLAVGAAAILGHIFPVYLKFKGGKGVATSFGAAIGFWPYYTVCAAAVIIIWVIIVLLSRYVSLASIAAAITFPLCLTAIIIFKESWQLNKLWPLLLAATAIAVMVIFRHQSNIKRIIAGTENKIGKGKNKI